MSRTYSISVAMLLIVGLWGQATGCNSPSTTAAGGSREARGVLRVLGVEYARFVTEHDGQPPANREELAAYVEKRKDRIRGLKEVEQLFTSPRDNQPLVIYYGKSMPPEADSGFPWIARESQGENGKLLVANTRGGVEELSVDQVPPHLGTVN